MDGWVRILRKDKINVWYVRTLLTTVKKKKKEKKKIEIQTTTRKELFSLVSTTSKTHFKNPTMMSARRERRRIITLATGRGVVWSVFFFFFWENPAFDQDFWMMSLSEYDKDSFVFCLKILIRVCGCWMGRKHLGWIASLCHYYLTKGRPVWKKKKWKKRISWLRWEKQFLTKKKKKKNVLATTIISLVWDFFFSFWALTKRRFLMAVAFFYFFILFFLLLVTENWAAIISLKNAREELSLFSLFKNIKKNIK